MGVVYKAEDTKLDRFVALKFLPPHISTNEDERKRFIREAKAVAALNHPNICTIYEIDESEDQTFLRMEYVDGMSLKDKLELEQIEIQEALELAIQISQGLQEAHEKGIVHRDIKSDNIMITPKSQAKIMDFGLARLVNQTQFTQQGTTLGTISYMSPEQTQGSAVDHRTDIWALGVVLYEMISGQLPFKGDYEQAIMYSIMNEDPEPLSALRLGLLEGLEDVVNKALAKNPDERYQHSNEMQVDLEKIKSRQKISSEIKSSKMIPTESKVPIKKIAFLAGISLLLVLGFLLLKPLFFEQVLISEPKPIAVISFQNQTGDNAYDYLQEAIPNLLITSLEQTRYLRVTTWERI